MRESALGVFKGMGMTVSEREREERQLLKFWCGMFQGSIDTCWPHAQRSPFSPV